MSLLSRIFGGGDRELAATRYAGRESASASASRKRREGHHRNLTREARKQQAREDRYWRDL